MITVTKPFLPPKEDYLKLIDGIWDRRWLTNHGPMVKGLESKLKDYLNIPYCSLVTNGTVALQIAIKALDLKGEIITTPFSYVATTSSIVWEGCQAVFADIAPDSFNIDPNTIEPLINENTSAIMATHVFGNPCNVERIEQLATKHNLKVIYDAAHAFGVEYLNDSVLNYGDVSTLSFHATKLFHTIEGGAVVVNNEEVFHKVKYMGNFGHNGKYEYFGLGINGKNSEFHAAMGVAILPYIDKIINKRKQLYERYISLLQSEEITFQKINDQCSYNYAYFPILLSDEKKTEALTKYLQDRNIGTRRYFRPSLSSLPYLLDQTKNTPNSNKVANSIICLPLYYGLEVEEVDLICELVNSAFQNF